jgi:4-hydroxy-3-methylbut-2-en-1-yl diphosphate synthase IspG/GcpE
MALARAGSELVRVTVNTEEEAAAGATGWVTVPDQNVYFSAN